MLKSLIRRARAAFETEPIGARKDKSFRSKKIAVCQYGYLRSYQDCIPKFLAEFAGSELSFFVFTPMELVDPQSAAALQGSATVDEKQIHEIYDGRVEALEFFNMDLDRFLAEKSALKLEINRLLYPSERYLSLFTQLQGSVRLLDEFICRTNTSFDLAIICRPDLIYSNINLIFEQKHPRAYTNLKRYVEDLDLFSDDRFIYGSPETILEFRDIKDNLEIYLNEDRRPFIPEEIVAYHLHKKGVPLEAHSPCEITFVDRWKARYEHQTGSQLSSVDTTLNAKINLIGEKITQLGERELAIRSLLGPATIGQLGDEEWLRLEDLGIDTSALKARNARMMELVRDRLP